MGRNPALLNAIVFLSLALIARSVSAGDESECVYTIYVRTGSVIKAGTDSKISLELWGQNGDGVRITDIESWGGLMGQNYDYFERGNLDVFSGRGPCLTAPVCGMRVISDGSGPHHGWYCNYVEVTTTGPHVKCAQQKFDVEQWLKSDSYPYELSATRNYCPVSLSKQAVPALRSVASS
ncbi:PLAT domain-containing protein 3-like [Chenopodium quinoa]|uniref:PLAT domain-containing protein n=1 Tax=Chenopodium quinoa TaxID=63459 RepID=A0A803KSL3_CHEQI|nr:PLAT domain-containing protein 3-like [Chenopodium quinoa]